MAPKRRLSVSPGHRKGRTEPDRAMHMSTRQRARGSNSATEGSANGSANGSAHGGDNQATSLDQARPSTSLSEDSRPSKVQRLSNGSRNSTSPAPETLDETNSTDHNAALPPNGHVPVKRGRATDVNDFAVDSAPQNELFFGSGFIERMQAQSQQPYRGSTGFEPNQPRHLPMGTHVNSAGQIVPIPSEAVNSESYGLLNKHNIDSNTGGKLKYSSLKSQQDQTEEYPSSSDEEDDNDVAFVAPDIRSSTKRSSENGDVSPRKRQRLDLVQGEAQDDATPLQSAPGSPNTSVTSAEDAADQAKDASGSDHQPGDLEAALTAGDEVALGIAAKGVKPSQKKVKGGRRRALRPDPAVEAALRRQLELKAAFRNISRSLRPVLTELNKRTLDELEGDGEYHKKATEHAVVAQQLKETLQKREAMLEAQKAFGKRHLTHTRDYRSEIEHAATATIIDNLKDAAFNALQHKALEIMRAANIQQGDEEYETEDEGLVVPRSIGMSYKFKQHPPPGPQYESRSRVAMDTRDAYRDSNSRARMARFLKRHDAYKPVEKQEKFTTMERTYRDFATEMGVSRDRTALFAEASEQFQKANVIPNHEATNLMALGDLATRPTIRQAASDALRLHELQKQAAQDRRTSMASSQFPTSFTRGGYDVAPMDFSRAAGQTTQGPSTNMPPPNTHRQASIDFLVGSPQEPRREPPRSPAPTSPGRTNFLASMPRASDISSQNGRPRASSQTSQPPYDQRRAVLPAMHTTERSRSNNAPLTRPEGLNFGASMYTHGVQPPQAPQQERFGSRLVEEAARAQRELMGEQHGSSMGMSAIRGANDEQHLLQQRSNMPKTQQEQSSAPGATDSQARIRGGSKSLGVNRKQTMSETKETKGARSRASSTAQSAKEINPSDSGKESSGEVARRLSGKPSDAKPHNLKTNKESRDGLSRRQHKQLKHGLGPKQHRNSTGSNGTIERNHDASAPKEQSHPLPPRPQIPAQASPTAHQPPVFSQPPSQHPDYHHLPPGYPQPPFPGQMPGPSPHHTYDGYGYGPYAFNPAMAQHHRNSYPPPPPQQFGYPSPLYSIPHHQAPPGPAENWGIPGFYGPPPGAPQAPPAGGPYGQQRQYGGPTIAPATHGGLYGGMGAYQGAGQGPLPPQGGHGPAFAQQARNSFGHGREGSSGGAAESRGRNGRSASDAGGGFKPWFGQGADGARR